MSDYAKLLVDDLRLEKRMNEAGIRPQDILEKFVRSQGPGGQNVNKTSTCVYLKHVPTGIEVKCQSERSQAMNRYLARKLLVGKIEDFIRSKLLKEKQKLEKARRQNRRRSRKSKLIILEEKRRRSLKKSLRQTVRDIE